MELKNYESKLRHADALCCLKNRGYKIKKVDGPETNPDNFE